MKYRHELINKLIKENNYKNYLEIGVKFGSTFNNIECGKKSGVDPNPIGVDIEYVKTSDSFFETNNEKFDIIFIDGLHTSEQVYKDIINSLNVLSPDGTIVCHDMKPYGYKEQLPIRQNTKYWNGDCWKAWLKLRINRNDLYMEVANIDHGCGIIRNGEQKTLSFSEEMEYEFFNKNLVEILNLKEPKDLKIKI